MYCFFDSHFKTTLLCNYRSGEFKDDDADTSKETSGNPKMITRQSKKVHSSRIGNIGSEIPKLAYLTVEEFEEIPK